MTKGYLDWGEGKVEIKSACHQGEGGTLMTGGDIVTVLRACVVFAMNLILQKHHILYSKSMRI